MKKTKRKLFYVPTMHSPAEVNRDTFKLSFESMLESYKKEYGDEVGMMLALGFFAALDGFTKKYWDMMEERLDREGLDYGKLKIFQEGAFDGEESSRQLRDAMKKLESLDDESLEKKFSYTNLTLLNKMLDKGARLMNTEDREVYKEQVEVISRYGTRKISKSDLKKAEEEIDACTQKRDKKIAERINNDFRDGTALLFVGAAHDPIRYLDKDIEIRKIELFDLKAKGMEAIDLIGEKAEEKIISMYEDKITSPVYWCRKGNKYSEEGEHEEALEYFDKALGYDTKHAASWYNKGNALLKLKRSKEAMKSYDKAIELKPNDPLCWYGKGLALGQMGRYREAIEHFDKTLELEPGAEYALKAKRIALEKMGKKR